ncbi:MAG: hypothetical protein ACE5G8_14380, partial [Anaerolineae bacterium]
AGLGLIKNLPQNRVYCNLRTYQGEFAATLLDCGFEQIAVQTAVVKHTTVRAKDFLTRLLPAFESVVEAKHAAPTAMAQADSTAPQKTNSVGNCVPGRLQFN